MASRSPVHAPDITIGIVGAEKFVYRIAEVAHEDTSTAYRLATAAYAKESDAGQAARKIANDVDVLLFAGPLPYNVALTEGPLPVPATYVPTGGASLPTALLGLALAGDLDIRRLSIDSVSEMEVAEVYTQLDLDMSQVRVMEYKDPVTPEAFVDFHLEHHTSGLTSGAITTVPSVAAALEARGAPHVMMEPVPFSLRTALRTARLMGSGTRMEDSRIAIALVRLPASALPHHKSSSNFWLQELRLSLHRALLHDARRMEAAVLPRDENCYLVITTMGSLRRATDDLSRAPFLATVAESLSIRPEIGIGLGRATVEAEENAWAALELAEQHGSDAAYLVPRAGVSIPLPGDPTEPPTAGEPIPDPASESLRTLAQSLVAAGDASLTIDADLVARTQKVTLRTARRMLHALVKAGLAWPMPPARDQRVGRPRTRYRLLENRTT